MTFKAMMFMLSVTENYSVDVYHMVIAVWFLSVGYLLYKRANRALTQYRSKVIVSQPQAELPCLSAGTYHTTGA
jgi:hypothetical protein